MFETIYEIAYHPADSKILLEYRWRRASVAPPPAPLPNPTEMSVLIDCYQCGHCIDLHTSIPTDAPQITAARKVITQQIQTWLATGQPSSFQ